ncbi:ADP-ribosylglycohydrolase family protein [Cryobacterium algoritolerans]|uniref:ADP-ribosylglycohydrolase family protein n=2 Tax=Cryobacterium algoritolerans TaxID=1259184 RepID=A0A4R8WXL4_9MICO|nr:ADP-ribosylglycohydrolase family protein [Cryobacterium algoritolerans]
MGTESAERDRALGAFHGLALGDALGMPTQSMSRSDILADYGRITGFRDAGPRQRIAVGMRAGTITDDTEQAVMLAGLLIDGRGHVDPGVFAARLREWEHGMKARGSLDLLGPSTTAALRRLTDGESALTSGRFGSTNGAAMRITPVGIAFGLAPTGVFVDAVAEASLVTHNTSLGIGSAAAVAAAVSAGVAGSTLENAIENAIMAAAEGEQRGHWVAGSSIAARIRWAVGHLAGLHPDDQADAVCALIGTSVAAQESVVTALALAAVSRNPWETLCLVAGLGGDTDTIAAICGAVLGSVHGLQAWPAAELDTLRTVNDLDLPVLVDGLLELRRAHHG